MGKQKKKAQQALGRSKPQAFSGLLRSAVVTLCAMAGLYASGVLPSKPQQLPDSIKSSPATVDFYQAKEHPELREAFIERFVKRLDVPSYVKSLEYREEDVRKNGKSSEDHLFRTHVLGEAPLGKVSGLESKIFVRPRAFSTLLSEEEFRAGLEFHEFRHASQLYNGFDFIKDEAFYVKKEGKLTYFVEFHQAVSELDALQYQLRRSMEAPGNFSEVYVRDIMVPWFENYSLLWRISSNDVDPKVIEMLKIRFFHDMMGNRPHELILNYYQTGSKYTIIPTDDWLRKAPSDDVRKERNVFLAIPDALNARIDSWFSKYQNNKNHYQNPEFCDFVNNLLMVPTKNSEN